MALGAGGVGASSRVLGAVRSGGESRRVGTASGDACTWGGGISALYGVGWWMVAASSGESGGLLGSDCEAERVAWRVRVLVVVRGGRLRLRARDLV